MIPPTYSTGLSAKGALLEETLAILRQIDQGHSSKEIQQMVFEHDLLAKTAQSTRESVWKRIHARYFGNQGILRILARMVTHAPDRQTGKLILFLEFCRSTPLLRDVTIQCVYPRYAAGFSSIDKSIIQQFFDEVSATHPELNDWSPQTREKVVSNILTILRDFGLLRGRQRKEFVRLYVPLATFVYALYRMEADGVGTPHEVLAAEDWRLFFLERTDIQVLLDEATAAGHCTFRHQGDVCTLDLIYPSLEACVEALATKA